MLWSSTLSVVPSMPSDLGEPLDAFFEPLPWCVAALFVVDFSGKMDFCSADYSEQMGFFAQLWDS